MCAYQNFKPNDFLPLMFFNVKWRFKLISKFVIFFVTSNHTLLSILAPHPDSREILGNSTINTQVYKHIRGRKVTLSVVGLNKHPIRLVCVKWVLTLSRAMCGIAERASRLLASSVISTAIGFNIAQSF